MRRAMRRVLTITCTRASASGGWPAWRASRTSTKARGKSTPSGTPKTRGRSVGSNMPISKHLFGLRDTLGMAHIAPFAGIAGCEQAIFGQHPVPQNIQRKSRLGDVMQTLGLEDLQPGIHEARSALRPAIGVDREIACAGMADGVIGRDTQSSASMRVGSQSAAS